METLEQALEEDRRATRFLKGKLYTDLFAQISILGIFFFNLGFGGSGWAFCTFYFVLGGYQLLSSLVHLAIPNACKNRKGYYIQLIVHVFVWLGIFLALKIGGVFAFGFIGLYIELLLSPLTAIYYFIVTIQDFQALPKYA